MRRPKDHALKLADAAIAGAHCMDRDGLRYFREQIDAAYAGEKEAHVPGVIHEARTALRAREDVLNKRAAHFKDNPAAQRQWPHEWARIQAEENVL